VFLLMLLTALVHGQVDPMVCIGPSYKAPCYLGSSNTTDLGTVYASFQGIQYAEDPVGELRFKPPQAFLAEDYVYDVSGVSDVVCPQLGMLDGELVGQEECLLLNVYIPNWEIIMSDLLPVMVWIHGGSLLFGSNRYAEEGPQQFLDMGVIIVTVNYRLGPLGFLSLGTSLVPGNVGLRDQSLALSWVSQNIARFGGDPDSVTIFGESAGSLSVALHLLSPHSMGLFQRAIMQSSSALNPAWGPITPSHALDYSGIFIQSLGCEGAEDVLSCLQEQNMADILALTTLGEMSSVWLPVPDGDFTSDPFLPGHPEELMKAGEFDTDIEVIVGTTKDEGILFLLTLLADPTLWPTYRENFDVYGPQSLFNIANRSEITEDDVENAHTIVEYYVGSIDNIDAEHKQGMFDMFTDAGFLYGTYKTIQYLLEYGVPVYQYILTHRGEHSFTEAFGIEPVGVCHADDLIYLWNPNGQFGSLTGEDSLVRNTMIEAWTNFAYYGDPTPPGSESSWTPLTTPDQYWNISGPVPSMESSSYIQERMDLWEQVIG